MNKYRKKPVVISAVRYLGNGELEGPAPLWFLSAQDTGVATRTEDGDPLTLATFEGRMLVSPGDWIIRGIQGELYPCKPDIFAATYDTVED